MGIVAAITPSGSFNQLTSIKRLKKKRHVAEIVKDREVPIIEYNGPKTLESFQTVSPLETLKIKDRASYDLQSEVFWHSNWYFSSSLQLRSLWSGLMQSHFSRTEDSFYKKSDVILLPIIDLQPTNLTCIYSTLLFIQSQLNISTPIITFDQPLWYKASGIIAEKSLIWYVAWRIPHSDEFYWKRRLRADLD